jgi:hypothetical protein
MVMMDGENYAKNAKMGKNPFALLARFVVEREAG